MASNDTPPVALDPLKWPNPPGKTILLMLGGVVYGSTYGFSMLIVTALSSDLGGLFYGTSTDGLWVLGAFFGSVIPGILLLYKFRIHFGMWAFVWLGNSMLMIVALSYWLPADMHAALLIRLFAGLAASTAATCSITYFVMALPPAYSVSGGFVLGLMSIQFLINFSKVIVGLTEDWSLSFGGVYRFTLPLALVACVISVLVPLPQSPTMRLFDKWDWISFPLLFSITLVMALAAVTGESYWWLDKPQLGWAFAYVCAATPLFFIIENCRERPIVRMDWFFSRPVMTFFIVLIMFRATMGSQTAGVSQYFNISGLRNEQLVWFYLGNTGAMVLGFTVLLFFFRVSNIYVAPLFLFISAVCAAIGCYFMMYSSSLSSIEQAVLPTFFINFAGALVLPIMQVVGVGSSKKAGGDINVTTYLTGFLCSQLVGAMCDVGIAETIVAYRKNFHIERIGEQMQQSNPLVNDRLQAEGIGALQSAVSSQATVMAINDLYFYFFILAIIGAIVVILLSIFNHIEDKKYAAAKGS